MNFRLLVDVAGRGWGQLLLLAIAVAAVYGHTLDVPFYLDDYTSILRNPAVVGGLDPARIWAFSPPRFVAYLSFAANYQLHGPSLAGFHLTNILIHLAVGVALWGFVRLLLRAPRIEGTLPPTVVRWLPLVCALIFLLHPLQTQAVTYVVQRGAALSALFYLLAMAAYVRARLLPLGTAAGGWFVAALLAMLLAFLSKQNSMTLPLALLLVELAGFRRSRRFVLPAILGSLLLLAGAALAVYLRVMGGGEISLAVLDALARESREIGRLDYFMTQMEVLWLYLLRFVWPVGLHLDYGYTLWNGGIGAYLALLAHLAVVGGALWLLRRRPLAAFGILFFYVAHAVESSIIPITDLVFEHRTYLPNAGLALLVGCLGAAAYPRVGRDALLFLFAVAVLLGYGAWERNQQWREPLALWQENVRLAPGKSRPWANMGRQLLLVGRNEEALAALERAVAIARDEGKGVQEQVALNLAVALRRNKQWERSLGLTNHLIGQPIKGATKAQLYVNKGNILAARGDLAGAEAAFRSALTHSPGLSAAAVNLGVMLARREGAARAEAFYREYLAAHPGARDVTAALGRLRAASGR